MVGSQISAPTVMSSSFFTSGYASGVRALGRGLSRGEILQNTYEVVRLAGRGGMGEVYETRHLRIPGRFAVKVLRQQDAPNEEALGRFRREAEITSSLRHPNIVQILDFNQLPDGSPYIVMEYLDGGDLADRLAERGTLPPMEVVRYVSQLASALAAAHAHGVVHRDLKPQNVLLVPIPGQARDFLKIVDFGISTVKGPGPGVGGENTVLGTPRYMAPEQAMGKAELIEARTDQFALAAIAYEMLAGVPPFEGSNVAATLYNVVNRDPPPLPRAVREVIGAAGEAALWRALSKNPTDRFPSILDFGRTLQEAAILGGAAAVGLASGAGEDERAGPPRERTPEPAFTLELAASAARAFSEPSTLSGLGPAPTGLTRPSPSISQRRHRVTVGGLAMLATVGWVVALLSPRVVEERVGAMAAPLIDEAKRLTVLSRPTQQIFVDVVQPPPGLSVEVDGHPMPLPLALPRTTAAYHLRFSAPGYRPHETWIDAVSDKTLHLPMLRAPRPL